MKKEALTYSLAIVAIAVSGFFGWNAKEKYDHLSKKVNKIELNGIKDVDADLIFERINRSIKNENK